MFLYQNGELYTRHNGEYVGVNITPKGIELLKSKTAKFIDGTILTPFEVRVKFKNNYKFPTTSLGVERNGRTKHSKDDVGDK